MLAVVCHHNDADEARIGMFFSCDKWSGEVTNAEPGKCEKLAWFTSLELPTPTVGYVQAAIDGWQRGQHLVLCGW